MGGAGGRVKGRPKKKGIKAALSSTAGSKRKLSRMGKKQKKDHAGLAATFIGRSRCLKLLQITLKDFRRLCILKGIYPREPLGRVPGKKKGQSFYHIKDIRAIAHEPVLEKFRDFQAFMKKVRVEDRRRHPGEQPLFRVKGAPSLTVRHCFFVPIGQTSRGSKR
jgi:pescadillo protein